MGIKAPPQKKCAYARLYARMGTKYVTMTLTALILYLHIHLADTILRCEPTHQSMN